MPGACRRCVRPLGWTSLRLRARFRMIEDDTAPVVITANAPGMTPNPAERLLERLARGAGTARELLRQLQPYIVGLPNRQLEHAQRRGPRTR